MKDRHKASFINLITNAAFGFALLIMMPNSGNAAPCFDNPQSAYKYLLAQENAKTQARDQTTVNINRASEGELVTLHGIGSNKAQAIILYRDMFGDFEAVDELARVKGVGKKNVEKNRGRLSVQD
ncbi:ComEA family DNA-binding protein [uncultured Psychrobacter sp.]|uniref:ComEA family DNA-binding protein n=1 Tax=uncultured Psychrobacter sp. TaxID=259303 RepID=UPI0026261281|nr:ComEA family DNA-binding protein [uncultured Psychrobacter sp.]